MVQLHRKYGPLIRLGPTRVSCSDPDIVRVMFGTNPVWEKAPSYGPSTPFSGGKSMPSIVAMTEAQSTAVHRVAGSAFTANALLDYEDYIDQSCAALLRAFKTRPKPIDINWWFGLFAMDVINRVAFGDSLGFLDSGEDVENLMAATKDRFDHWGHWSAVPGIERFLFKSPFSRLWRKQGPSPLAAAAQKKLSMRQDPEAADSKDRLDLLGKFLEGSAKHPGLVTEREIIGMCQSAIGAGADTTAATLSILYVYLARNPEVVTKMREELSARQFSNPPKWEEVRSLPYLEAVIKEAMRLFPVSQWGHDRTVPPEGVTVAGYFVPGGTTVQCHIDSIQRNASIFGADPDLFNPDRWLVAGDERRLRMEGNLLGFGSGKRMCIGKHIAWLEMKKLIPLLTLHLDVCHSTPLFGALTDNVRLTSISRTWTLSRWCSLLQVS